MTEKPLRPRRGDLAEVRINGLLGDKDISIMLDGSLPTVLTGRNGSGKSTVLKAVHACSEVDPVKLFGLPLKRIGLSFGDGEVFTAEVRRDAGAVDVIWRGRPHTFRLHEGLSRLPSELQKAVLRNIRTGSGERIKPSDLMGSISDYSEFRYTERVIAELNSSKLSLEVPPWLKEFSEYFVVDFIGDNRLVESLAPKERIHFTNRNDADKKSAIELAAEHIGQLLLRAESSLGRRSEAIGQKLPRKVIQAMKSRHQPSADSLFELAARVSTARADLHALGLVASDADETIEFLEDAVANPDIRRVVHVVLQSNLERLGSLDFDRERLSTFSEFVNRRLVGKRMQLGGRRGIVFLTDHGDTIRVNQLSSGEQHLVILAFDLLFAARMKSLVIIDEPEISLHVAWQDWLLQDLMRLGRPRGLKFFMASHAPTIIASMPDCEFPMEGWV